MARRWMLSLVGTWMVAVVGCGGATTPAPGGSGTADGTAVSKMPGADGTGTGGANGGTGGVGGGNVIVGGAPECTSGCCYADMQGEGAACASSDDGRSCPKVVWCPAAAGVPQLVLEHQALTCSKGTWLASGETCPVTGTVNELGCPAEQPSDGATCAAPAGTQCHYALDCVIGAPCPPPDEQPPGTACAQGHQVASDDATCTNGKWTTKAVTCPGG